MTESISDPEISIQSEPEVILQVNQLAKRYDNVIAVNGLSFEIRRGEIYGLLGPNGAGKTTTIKSILGMVEVDYGSIRLLDLDPVEQPQKVKSRIGYVAEEPLLYESMTPSELFNFISSVRKLDSQEATRRCIDLLESLDARKHYHDLIATLSKGNRQKIQIIASLIHDPELLILDEPLTGLDAKSRRIVRNILALHTQSGKSVLLSTHAMEDAQGLCDRIGIINRGSLIAEGTLEELSQLSKSAGSTLEEIFLELTQQDESVANATARLADAYHQSREET